MNRVITRRKMLTSAAAVTLSACGSNKGGGYPGYALIANYGDKTVSAVDLTRFRLTKTISMGAAPTAVVPAVRGLAAVLTPSIGTVHLIDSNLNVSASRRLADQVNEIRVTTDGQALLAVSEPSRELIQVDPATLRVIRRYKLPFAPTAIDLSMTGYVAIAGGSDGDIELIQMVSGARTHCQVPHPLGSLTFRADGKLLLAANLQGRSILALHVPTLQLVAELPLAMQPEHLCFNADQGQLFVSGSGMDGVAVIFPYNTLEVDQTLLAGHAPGPMACSESPPYLFVAATRGSSVCVLNIDTRKQLGSVEIGETPTFITTTSDSRYALILARASGNLAVIHIPAIRTNSTANRLKNGTALFTMLNVGSDPVHAAILPRAT